MGIGIGAPLTVFSPGVTISSSSMNSDLSAIDHGGISNDSIIQTDGLGHITAANGYLSSVIILATPYHLVTNPTVPNGSTTTLTCTGGSTGVPSGASAVLLGVGIIANVTTGYVQIAPHGATLGNYVNFSSPQAGQYIAGFVIAPLSTGGQLDVKANGANIVLQDWYILGYII